MKVLRMTRSGRAARHASMRRNVPSAFAGRFMSFRIRGLACWNGTSR